MCVYVLCTLAGLAISRNGETLGAGAVVGAHDIVACMRTGVSNITFILICNNRDFTLTYQSLFYFL